jgi:hypothetical protein
MLNLPAHHRPRIAALLATALAALVSACASLKSADAPGCAGVRRPANPHGSVLEPGASAAATTRAPTSPCGRTGR